MRTYEQSIEPVTKCWVGKGAFDSKFFAMNYLMLVSRGYRRTLKSKSIVYTSSPLYTYSVDEYLNRLYLKTAECYGPVSEQRNYIAPMNNGGNGVGICTCNDLIYVVVCWPLQQSKAIIL
ncbi:hypothetical protein GQX74_014510 [Glossina fuscipes]|nr:hypothetical protein GQX74_014510 [Glossina fuscipes]